jgi:hypothetical protein
MLKAIALFGTVLAFGIQLVGQSVGFDFFAAIVALF